MFLTVPFSMETLVTLSSISYIIFFINSTRLLYFSISNLFPSCPINHMKTASFPYIFFLPLFTYKENTHRSILVNAIYYQFTESISNGKSATLRVATEDSNLTSRFNRECTIQLHQAADCRMISSTVLKTFRIFITLRRCSYSESALLAQLLFYGTLFS